MEVNTDIGMVGREETSLLRPIPANEVVGEAGAMVTDTDSGHGAAEEIKQRDGCFSSKGLQRRCG